MKINRLAEYGHSFQIKVIAALLSDRKFVQSINDILTADYFESQAHKWIVNYIKEYFSKYNTYPTMEVLHVEVKKQENETLRIAIIDTLRDSYTADARDIDYVKEEFLNFCKNQNLKQALLESVDLLNDGNYDAIRRLIDTAIKSGQVGEIGHVYDLDVETRYRDDDRNPIPLPWAHMNELTQGGTGAGDLMLLFGNPGGGKSWFAVAIGAYAAALGYNVAHYTLELSETYMAKRYDSVFSGVDIQDLKNNKAKIQKAMAKVPGKIVIKEFPPKRASLETIKSHVAQLKNNMDFEPDLIIIDYLDLLRGPQKRNESHEEVGDIYTEAKGLARELNKPIISPSQVNRQGAKDDVIEGDKASGSYAKIMISDICLSVSRKRKDKVHGTGRVHVMKNRYGPDGLTYGAKINTNNGKIVIAEEPYDEDGDEPVKKGTGGDFDDTDMDILRTKFKKYAE